MKDTRKRQSIDSALQNANRKYKLDHSASQADQLLVIQQQCTIDLARLLHDDVTRLIADIAALRDGK